MKRILLISLTLCSTILSFGQCGMSTGGLYVAESPDNSEYMTYLRFFEDGTMLIADSKSEFDEVIQWMEKGRETVMETEYDLNKKCELEYTLDLDRGKVKYEADVSLTDKLKVTRSLKGYSDTIIDYEFVVVEFDE